MDYRFNMVNWLQINGEMITIWMQPIVILGIRYGKIDNIVPLNNF